jgi:hypothetical protein
MTLAAVPALVVLGPLRNLFEGLPLVTFLSAAFLFVMPGALMARGFIGEHFTGVALIPQWRWSTTVPLATEKTCS